ncbi:MULTISPECIES: hypothetical protein [Rhizobium]|uniref:hypothetical protein n=1 Tax=Rhizobium TaxID=379 RepID=UPI001B31BCFC|nr:MULTISPECIES: hypothetical protein [Rhizobium]MBX4909048.1 hypothetical protein [Rhizobium bangladeshense]MBX5231854.1 hypothetical protein [Rhizobium sp. NLR4a]MBX5258180.1 hypothetical protein [Rhizobium sp. NLR16b]MBX5264273.1 hypothetical protein [Rhizobium sp. NLR16a]MBX5269985.1 hypothetical protein [Rhizobium sp. NLR17b]
MSEQLSLLDWKSSAEVLPFPFHRSHGATAGVARAVMRLDAPKRTARLNSLRAQTRKRMEPLFGADQAEAIADSLIRVIRIQIAYHENLNPPLPKQSNGGTSIVSLAVRLREHVPTVGGAEGMGQGAKLLAGLGGAHKQVDYDAACEREGGTA